MNNMKRDLVEDKTEGIIWIAAIVGFLVTILELNSCLMMGFFQALFKELQALVRVDGPYIFWSMLEKNLLYLEDPHQVTASMWN